ncbi:MAG TPA: lysophospholipid acyltransferase family protein [Myxococcota bacterium]|nr:lysophospholipid acyltransferase family protein [Myxococcota bacterium]
MRSLPSRRLATAWRALRTGVAFAAFGLWSVWLAVAWLRIRALLDRGHAEPWRRAQRAIYRMFGAHARLMEMLGLIEVHWIGAERLAGPGPRIIVANHPSLIDVVLIISRLPQADCIVASAQAKNRWLRGSVEAADYITNDSGADVVREAARRLHEGRTLLVFPEGTRTPESGGLGHFQRGAAHIALAAGLDMLPIEIRVEPRMLMKGQAWYHVPVRAGRYTLRVGEPVIAKDHLDGSESTVMAARKLTRALRSRFAGTATP